MPFLVLYYNGTSKDTSTEENTFFSKFLVTKGIHISNKQTNKEKTHTKKQTLLKVEIILLVLYEDAIASLKEWKKYKLRN